MASKRQIWVKDVPIGGGAPVVVQSMTKTDTSDVEATLAQIGRMVDAGCELVRVAVPRDKDAVALETIVARSPVPVIADIHFNHTLALKAIDAGAHCIRLNPGNIGGREKVAEVAAKATAAGVPMRIGVNSGSLPKHLHELEREDPVEALVTAAIEFVELMESLHFENFKVSVKSTNVPRTIAANRLLAGRIDYPLHLGITESGTRWSGSLKSAVGLGALLADGIGDTIRISLSTFKAEEEVKVAWEILKALELRERGPVLIACPTCGRLQFDMDTVVGEIEQRLESYEQAIEVAVLGCAVNGIGEASHADFGITGAKNEGLIFAHGKPLRKVPQDSLVDELFAEIDRSLSAGSVQTDATEAAEATAWLERIEDENAGELTPERIAQMESAAAPDGGDAVLERAVAPTGPPPVLVTGRRFKRAK
jgi:(E)-4-hydroxy-3-methylbut-2-enyl-diphosphate synthase